MKGDMLKQTAFRLLLTLFLGAILYCQGEEEDNVCDHIETLIRVRKHWVPLTASGDQIPVLSTKKVRCQCALKESSEERIKEIRNMSVWFDPSGMVVPIGANHTGPVIYKNSRNISDGFIVVRLTLLIRKAFTCLETGVYTCSFGGEEKRDFFIDSPNDDCTPQKVSITSENITKTESQVYRLRCTAEDPLPTEPNISYSWTIKEIETEEIEEAEGQDVEITFVGSVRVTCYASNSLGKSSATITIPPPVVTSSVITSITPSTITPSTSFIIPPDISSTIPPDTSSIIPLDISSTIPPDISSIITPDTSSTIPLDISLIITPSTSSTIPPETPSIIPPETPSTITPDTPSTVTSDTPFTIPPDTPSAVTPDTSSIIPPHTPSAVTPDISSIIPPDTPSAVTSDTSSIIPPDTPSAVTPDTSSTTPSDLATLKTTVLVIPAGTSIIVPHTTFIDPSETASIITPDFSSIIIIIPDTSSIIPSDTSIITPDTSIITPDTSIITPDTSIITPSTSSITTPSTSSIITPSTSSITTASTSSIITPSTSSITTASTSSIITPSTSSIITPSTSSITTPSTSSIITPSTSSITTPSTSSIIPPETSSMIPTDSSVTDTHETTSSILQPTSTPDPTQPLSLNTLVVQSLSNESLSIFLSWSAVERPTENITVAYSWTSLLNARTVRNVDENRASVVVSPDATNYTIQEIEPYSLYCFKISTEFATGPFSSELSCIDSPETAPSEPLNVLIRTNEENSVDVRWEPPSHPNGVITHYTIYINSDTVQVVYTNQTNGSSSEATVTGLSPYATYSISVTAANSAGEGPQSAPMTFTLKEPTTHPPGEVPTLNSGEIFAIVIVLVAAFLLWIVVFFCILFMYYAYRSGDSDKDGSSKGSDSVTAADVEEGDVEVQANTMGSGHGGVEEVAVIVPLSEEENRKTTEKLSPNEKEPQEDRYIFPMLVTIDENSEERNAFDSGTELSDNRTAEEAEYTADNESSLGMRGGLGEADKKKEEMGSSDMQLQIDQLLRLLPERKEDGSLKNDSHTEIEMETEMVTMEFSDATSDTSSLGSTTLTTRL